MVKSVLATVVAKCRKRVSKRHRRLTGDSSDLAFSEPIGSPYVQKSDDGVGLIYRTTEDATPPAPQPDGDDSNGDARDIDPLPEAVDEFSKAVVEKLRDVNAQITKLRAEVARIERERKLRNEVMAERSSRVAELQRQNAATRAELERQALDRRLEEFLREHSARVERLEMKLGIALNLLDAAGIDWPRGAP